MDRSVRVALLALVFMVRPSAAQLEKVPPNAQEQPTSVKPSVPDPNTTNASEILRTFRTLKFETSTWLAKPEMCEGALQSYKEFETWDLTIVRTVAEVVITIDHQPGWFYYQYSMVHPRTGVVLASGNVTAWDGKTACGSVAKLVVERIKRARTAQPDSSQAKPQKKEQPKKD